ncbi:fumarylacetoacetate hydrolase family protein [Francisella frigiditurris]|uniref:Fumarylacetoacetate (FAA) hydrolase family protein n=1 Tax=Francisella frigiditurris TaxID=1542390 RepID=A0A1J0KV13_9GAMM|nr:fumarylacetoacetate hydrolase family protein [Francisella frigiditurris]APC97656.1 fumarylacetoacetate (FAA) hydrolase family protein [Francisella frigiditurris]
MYIDKSKSKVICIGRNYIEHIYELENEIPENPVIFIKPNSSITASLKIPNNREIHYEVEIVFAFSDKGEIKGVGLGIDLTDRALQTKLKSKGLPWELAKAFDNSAILSEFVEIKGEDLKSLNFRAYKNGEIVQQGSYDLMIHKPCQIVQFLKENNISILENDFLMTGTPKGVGVVYQGDIFNIDLFLDNKKILKAEFK